MKKIRKYYLWLVLILILAALLRFYHFSERWDLGGDGARDAIIAREALARRELPLIGSFASAGPFVFGPMLYWFIILSYLLLPFIITAPWIMSAVVGVMTVFILMDGGRLIGGRKLSILIGLLAAASPQLVVRSLLLGQHSFIAITTALLIYNFLLLWRKEDLLYAFFMGLSLGVALNMHYQAINLFIFLPGVFLIRSLNFKKKVMAFFLMMGGLILPSLPLLIWDSRQQWANIRNILDYLLIGQHRLYVPNSWRLFLFKYLPDHWGFVLGRYRLVGLTLMALLAIAYWLRIWKRKMSGEMVSLGIMFLMMIIINRYYGGERSEGYLVYLTPFIIIFSGWTVLALWRDAQTYSSFMIKLLPGLVVLSVLAGNFISYRQTITFNNGVKEKQNLLRQIYALYPDKKFSLYDYQFENYNMGWALSYLLSSSSRSDREGYPVGVICSNHYRSESPVITTGEGCDLVSLEGEAAKKETPWGSIAQESIYDDLIGWSKKNELHSSFSLRKYLNEKLFN